MKIETGQGNCTVIVTVDGSEKAVSTALEHASQGLTKFADFDGFIGGATHLSVDGCRLVQYLQWKDEASHTACINDPSWEQDPLSRRFQEMAAQRDLTVDVRIYRVMAERTGP